jgi:hypothetical protein
MNRRLWKPALSLVVLLVLAGIVTLLCRGNNSPAQAPSNPPADEPAAKPADNPKPVSLPKTVEPAKPAADPQPAKAQQSAEPSKAVATPKASAEAGNAAERRQLLETVGTLIAAHCWQTYFNIGLLADGRAKGVYNDKDATKVLDSILSIIGTVDQKLTTLDKLALEKQDLTSLAQMRELSVFLRRQANDLQSLWDNGREEDAARYESSRKDAWAGISKLLGVGR